MNKKKLSQRIYDAIWPNTRPQTAKRSYQAARQNRLNVGWTTFPTVANYEIRDGLAALIARSRQASRDDPHISKYFEIQRSNVVGAKGIMLQANARSQNGSLNVDLNKRVEEAWWQWCHAENCTVTGKLDFKGIQDLALTQVERDGAFLIEMIDTADNEFGFALKSWDITWFDLTYDDTLPSGNRVIMSVEIDANDRPVAYWLTTPPSDVNFTRTMTRTRTRKPAESMIHGFFVNDDGSQVHGIPSITAVLVAAKNRHGYNEGVITSARVSANTYGFIKQDLADGEEWTGAEDTEGNLSMPIIDSAPLSINLLNPGQSFEQFDPKQPTQNHSAFTKTLLMELAAGLGIPYFLLADDWEATNFSSSRGGLGEAREMWRGRQNFLSSRLCRRVYNAWAKSALLKGKLKVTAREYKEIQNPTWRARGWRYIDPTKDIAADIERLKYRLATPSEILSEQGIDYVDHLERWQADVKLAKSYGVDIEELYVEQPKQLTAGSQDPPPEPKKRGYLNGHDTDELLN